MTKVRQITEVVVNVRQRAVTYTLNTLVQAFYWIAISRKLGLAYMETNRDIIESGLLTWLNENSLTRLHLEVYVAGQLAAVERWDFAISFGGTPSTAYSPPPVAGFGQISAKLKVLPPGAQYRIVVETTPNATVVPGWEETVLRPLNASSTRSFSAWGYGHIETSATLRHGG